MPERRETPKQRNLRQRSLKRREFLGLSGKTLIAVGGAVALGGGGVVWLLNQRNNNLGVERVLADYRDKEKQLAPVIANFEQGFHQFSQVLRAKAAAAKVPAHGQRSIENPLELAEINLQNPDRNSYTLKRKDLEARGILGASSAYVDNPNFFSFGLLKNQPGIVAGYEPPTKTFYMNPAYDPNNLLDNLVAFHELIHVAQDTQDRQEIPAQNYLAFFEDARKRKVTKVLALYEATAYMEELFALDLLTDGRFKADVLSRQFSVPTYRSLLKTRPEQDSTVALLGTFGEQLFNGVSNWGVVDARFVNFLKNTYRQQGMEVYERVPSGFVLAR